MASPQYNNYMQQAQQPLSRPNSQPAPTQPGFGTQSGATALTQPPMVQRPPTQQGFATMTQPPAGGLGTLQQFGQAGGFNPQFGGFGNQNPQMQQYRQQLDAWRSQRPDMQPGMDRDAFRQQMDAWHNARPDRNNMQQYMPQYGQGATQSVAGALGMPDYMRSIMANVQGAQGGQPSQDLAANAYQQFQQQQQYANATPVAGQQAALQNAVQQYGQALTGGQPTGQPAQLTPQQMQSMQGILGSLAGANPAGTVAPLQAVMPPAPTTQQIAQEPQRMQAMRNMQRIKPGFGG